MIETPQVLAQFGERMEALLRKERDPSQLMAEILAAAESAGITDAPGGIRHNSPSLFVADLLTDNPAAFEWMQSARQWIKPLSIANPDQLLDAIRQ